MPRLRRHVSVVISASLLIAACTRPDDTSSTDATLPPPATTDTTAPPDTSAPATSEPTTTTTTTTPDTTTSAPSTSAPASSAAPAPTTGAPTTTDPPDAPEDLVLTFDSIGPWRFGQRDVDVVPGLAAILGAPVDDVLATYPVAEEGFFLDESGEQAYVAPFGRTVCFAAALCAQFGAGAPETLILTGWRLAEDAPAELATADGVTIGSTWADHADVIAVDPLNSCFQVGYADSGGIDVVLLSATGPFAAPNDNGEFVAGDPDPAQVTVIELRAGEHPTFVFADC